MKVLQLCSKVPYPPKDGGCAAMMNMAEIFYLMGAEVKMLSMETHKHPFLQAALTDELQKKFSPESVAVDTRIKAGKALYNLFFTKRSYHLVRFESEAFTTHLTKLLKTFQPDVVLLDSLYTGGYNAQIRAHSKAKIIYRAHNVEFQIWEAVASQTGSMLKKKYLGIQSHRLRHEEIKIIESCDGIISITERDHEFFSRYFPHKKILTLPFTVDISNYTFNQHAETKSIFFIGAMDWFPNVEAAQWLIEKVWPAVSAKHTDAKFYIAGKAMPETLQHHLPKNIINMGEVEDAAAFMAEHAIMLAPLFSGGGLKIKMIEAMASGKVVICTSKAAEGIEAIDGTHLLIAETAEAFVQKIDDCLNGKINLKGIGENACKLIDSHFGIASKAKTIQTFLQSV
jgi:glycosyltransferase involved in cell wall biosynthesis